MITRTITDTSVPIRPTKGVIFCNTREGFAIIYATPDGQYVVDKYDPDTDTFARFASSDMTDAERAKWDAIRSNQ